MSQVEQLIKKALSTTSDAEAVACLKQARKRYNGQSVDIDLNSDNDSQRQILKYQEIAYRAQESAKFLQKQLFVTNNNMADLRRSCLILRKRAEHAEKQLRTHQSKTTLLKFTIAGLFLFMMLFLMI